MAIKNGQDGYSINKKTATLTSRKPGNTVRHYRMKHTTNVFTDSTIQVLIHSILLSTRRSSSDVANKVSNMIFGIQYVL